MLAQLLRQNADRPSEMKLAQIAVSVIAEKASMLFPMFAPKMSLLNKRPVFKHWQPKTQHEANHQLGTDNTWHLPAGITTSCTRSGKRCPLKVIPTPMTQAHRQQTTN